MAGFLHTAANFAAINCPPYKYNFQNQMPEYTEPFLFVSLFKNILESFPRRNGDFPRFGRLFLQVSTQFAENRVFGLPFTVCLC